ncbi:solute carrier family 26 member 6-like [Mercenaria mercenaria]|uniref:solute carrier family 26 member 6-like n=1 Tax=Mercenaria mercenaria TaxID=6596 RepID=UPI00234EFD56|nr:solute carrier family 26 member 6-like [Mercenaria mercenaria]
MASINRDLREALLSKTQKRKFRVQMLDASQKQLREGIENKLHIKQHAKSIYKETRKCCPQVECSRTCASKSMHEMFPFIRIMRRYSIKRNLLADVVAGLTVGIMHIPQGMAYGFLSQLPPIYGLYTSFFPVLLYFFFGSSRHVSIGTFAVVSLMVGQVVNKGYQTHVGAKVLTSDNASVTTLLSTNTTLSPNPQVEPLVQTDGYANPIKLGHALSVTFVVGCMQLLMGVMRLGFMASFMSDPFISGFTTGAAIHVFSSQIKHVFGVHVNNHYGPFALVYFYSEFVVNIVHTNMVTFTASLTCMLMLVLIKEGINNNKSCKQHLLMPIPIELIVISISTVVSYYTKLGQDFGVEVVGEIPSGLPEPSISNLQYIPEVLGDGLTIGFIAYAISYSMAKILADRHGYRVNANQELVGLGVCNFVSSFFSSYCCAASLSRSLVQDAAGGKTQVVGLVSSMVVLVVLLYIGPLFESLPECILASIVIVTLKGMFLQFLELKRLWKLSKKDFAVWMVTFIAVVILDVALGLLIGIVFSLYFVLRHSQKPQMSQLGQLPGTGAYKDLKTTKQVHEVPGMKIFRFETSLYFANAEHFRDKLYVKTGLIPRKLLKRKRKAMHETLQRRREELEQIEYEKKRREARKIRPRIEIVTPRPVQVDEYEEQIKKATENKLIMDRFAKAWQPPIKILILDLSVVNYVDTVAVKQLSTIVKDYKEVGIKVLIAGCKPDVRLMLRNAEFYKNIDYTCLFFTVHEAVIIGQEVVDAEIRKNIPKREDVKLMIELTVDEEDKEKSDQEIYDDDDDDEDDSSGKQPDVQSDDDEQWYDTSPDDIEMRAITHDSVGIGHRDSSEKQAYGVLNRQGSIIKDANFEMISLKESIK